MTINYIGHSCFLLRGNNGTSLVTDPFGDVGLSFPRIRCDVVTVSHGHFDHSNVGAVGGDPVVLSEAGKFSVAGMDIEAKECFHDDANGSKRGKNLIFTVCLDGVTVCHLGDLGQRADENILRSIGRPDVLLIPVGGNYTIDGEEAAKYVRAVRPAAVIPMHYYVEGLKVDIADESRFLKAMGGKFSRQKEAVFERNNLPSDQKIIIMERMNG